MGTQQFSLRWNNYLRHITSAFDSLRTDKDLVDVTLSCEGKKIKAHKMLLSACSSYFKDLFKDNPCQHPVVIFRNVKFEDLDALVNFMYQGEVNVLQEQLASFLTTAELLEVQGLTDGGTNPEEEEELETEIVPPPPVPQREFRPEKRRSQPQSSNETMSPVSFIPINKRPESPLTKRRKFLSSSSSMKPSEKDTESRRHAQQQQQQQQQLSSPDPVEVIPVVPNVKIEKPEYYESDQGGGEYSDSMHASNSNQEMTDMSEHGHLDSKQEAVDIYEDSGDSSHLEGLSDLSSILSKPGTSVESVSQESLHDSENQVMLSNSMQLSLSDVFSYLRKNPASNTSVTDPLLVPMDNVNSKIIKTLLPLMNFEYLSSFEEHVRREDFRDSVIRHLRLKGGESLGNAVRRILVCLLTDEFAQNFSWLGFKKKKVFTDTCLPDIIFDAIRCQESFKNASDTEIAKPLRSWLVHAKDRANSKKDSTQTTATRRSFNSKHK